jgi:hypothetical protein
MLDRRKHVPTAVAFHFWRTLLFWDRSNLAEHNSPVAQGGLRRVQHLRDKEEIMVRANPTIKYEFILGTDFLEFACRAECHHMLARYDDHAPRRMAVVSRSYINSNCI